MADYDYEKWLDKFRHSIDETMVGASESATACLHIDTYSVQDYIEQGREDDLHLDAKRCRELTAKADKLDVMVRNLHKAIDELADDFKEIM